jgi:16S rRNA (cytidine1402-2'-O)-methyltransferase
MNGNLYLIPTPIGTAPASFYTPLYLSELIQSINYYIVENERTGRRHLLKMGIKTPIDDLHFFVLNKHTQQKDIESFLEPALKGHSTGLLSEAGLPGIADPGASITKLAHQKNIRVIPVTGPSSIFLALMASGLNGQNFAFSGYLPINKKEKIKTIRKLEKTSVSENQTQIFIEAPYRNNQLLEDLINSCHPETLLCIAANITMDSEFIATKTIGNWKKQLPDLHKRPAVFLLHGNKPH